MDDFQNNFFSPFTFLITLFLLVFVQYFWVRNFEKNMDNEKGIQKILSKPSIRAGGFIIFLSIFLNCIFFSSLSSNYLIIFFSLIPVFIASIVEDLGWPVKPNLRLLAIFISSILIVFNTETLLGTMDIVWVNKLLEVYAISFIFTIVGIAATSNAWNFIDGLNGLSSGLSIVIMLFFSYLAFQNSMFEFGIFLSIISSSIFSFWLLNVIFGRLVLGDTGAYLIGIILGWSGVKISMSYENVSAWVIFFIIIYPATELIFTIFRRIISKKSPFEPDSLHLHSLFYNYFIVAFPKVSNQTANSFCGVIITIYGSLPILIYFILNNLFPSIFYSIIIYILSYILIYLLLISRHANKVLYKN